MAGLLLHPLAHQADQSEAKGMTVQRKMYNGAIIIDSDYWIACDVSEMIMFRFLDDGTIQELKYHETAESIMG